MGRQRFAVEIIVRKLLMDTSGVYSACEDQKSCPIHTK